MQEYQAAAQDFVPLMLASISTSMRRTFSRPSSSSSDGYYKAALPEVYNLLD